MHRKEDEIVFDIIEHKGSLGSANDAGFTKEVNVIAWEGGIPKLDIRSWDKKHEKMSRGITLYEEEGIKLIEILKEKLPSEWPAPTEKDRLSAGEIFVDRLIHLGTISKPSPDAWALEVNIVSWNGGPAKLDIRSWDASHERMSRGMTLLREEAIALAAIDAKFNREVT